MSAYGQPAPPMPPLRGLPPVPDGLPYHLLHVAGRPAGGGPSSGVLIMLGGLLYRRSRIVAIIPFVVWYAVTGADLSSSLTDAPRHSRTRRRPALAYLNLALGLADPAPRSLVNWLLHGLTPGWLASVARAHPLATAARLPRRCRRRPGRDAGASAAS